MIDPSKRAVTVMALVGLGFALQGGPAFGQEKKGTTPYVTHFIIRPLLSLDVGDLGTATTLEAVGTTQNMKGEKMLDKMSARCVALADNVLSNRSPVSRPEWTRLPHAAPSEFDGEAFDWGDRSEVYRHPQYWAV